MLNYINTVPLTAQIKTVFWIVIIDKIIDAFDWPSELDYRKTTAEILISTVNSQVYYMLINKR